MWSQAACFTASTPESEVRLTLQSLLFELDAGNTAGTSATDVKAALLNTSKLCGDEPKLQVQWCRLAVLALNNVQCTFTPPELNECVVFVLGTCKLTNYLYCTVEALGAVLYDVDLNLLNTLYELVGEGGIVLQLCLGQAPEREVQHLALRCLNNMLESVIDEVFVTHIVSTLVSLATSRLHGDNLNRARLLAGAMRCLQTAAKHTKSQYVLEQILATVKGVICEDSSSGSALSSPAISLDSLSLDELNLSSDNYESQGKHSQPRVRNKKGRNKKRKPEVVVQEAPTHQRRGQSPSVAGGAGSWRRPNPAASTDQNRQQAANNTQNRQQSRPTSNTQNKRPTASVHTPTSGNTALNANQTSFKQKQEIDYKQKTGTDFTQKTELDKPVSSESEYSESDTEEGHQNKIMSVKGRMRLSTLLALQHCIISVHKSRMYSVWEAFLPPADAHSGLLASIKAEQSVKCRIAGIGALTTLIESAKHYFVAADSRPATSAAPYTPFSASLAKDLIHLHSELALMLTTCQPAVLPHLLQCIAVLVLHTPFSKLEHGIISNILTQCSIFLDSSELYKTQSGALNLLCSCLTAETPLKEVGEWLSVEAADKTVEFCIQHLRQAKHHKEVLQILCQLLRFYFIQIMPWWCKISEVAKFTLRSTADPLIQNMSLLVFEELGRALTAHLDNTRSCHTGSDELEVAGLKEHWVDVLTHVVVPILQEEDSILMPGACDILSTIGNTVFSSFEVHTQRLIMTLLLALTNPAVPATSSACRCLGVLVMYPCIRDDLLFVADTANAIITALETTDSADSGLLLRVSWSLGNLSDTLVVNKVNNPTFERDFSDLLLGRLLDVSLKAASANDKVKSNIVRALGNLLRFMKQSTYDKAHFKEYVSQSVGCLLKSCSAGMMKTRWNACYALVNALQNPVLSPAQSPWGQDLFTTLLHVISHCKNFKVRINAVLALCQCRARADYGAQFSLIWSSVLVLLCDHAPGTGHMGGYTDKLRLQLLHLLSHLLILHTPSDKEAMTSGLPSPHLHHNLVTQCSVLSTSDNLLPADRELFDTAKLVCEKSEGEEFSILVHKMLNPRTLPSDSEAFITSDISSNKHTF